MIGTGVEATRGLAVLAGGVPDGMAGGPTIVVEPRRYARWGFRLRFPAIFVRVALGIAVALVLAPALGAIAGAAPGEGAAQLTPVGMRVDHAPIPVQGSDGRYHVVYELELTNFSSDGVTVDHLDVLDARHGTGVASLGAEELAGRLVVRDAAAMPGSLGAAQAGLVYMHLIFEERAVVPQMLDHRLSVVVGSQPFSETAGRTQVARPTDLVFDSPLRGVRLIAGDGCCDAVRHIRATLPVNGRLFTAQRFAIDWEQLDDQGRIYVGNPKDPASYVIYGQPVYAVAEARVVTAVDGLPDTPPGALPVGITLEQADGNHVVLDLGDGRYALYAHLKPGSVQVHEGERVRRGQVLGLVGTSGNSSEPHLHFHVTDGPSPLASNGVPYLLRSFRSTERGVSTAAFDQAIVSGQPIEVEPVPGPPLRARVLPLDLWIVDFPGESKDF
jgi:Peptidase family M23